MSGDDVTSSNQPDAQQMMPTGAGLARAATEGHGSGIDSEVNWVGQQQLMRGYCGRAARPAGPGAFAGGGDAAIAAAPEAKRPVALHQRPRGLVVRIGPKPPAESAGVRAKAA